jgi:putative ATPase
MLEAGEDARYIARRLVILASEDVGMADSMGLVVADAAARAVEFVGLPEAGLNLAHAVIYLATAPKSNTVMSGLVRASGDVRRRQAGAVPGPLRSVHPYQRNKLKEGGGYRYPHNDPSGFVPQEYRPPEIAGEAGTADRRVYYRPSPHGDEGPIGRRLREWWGDAPYDTEAWWEFEKFGDPDRR